jgi:sterol desaturase/sphingolipid hydroxylase (fatty acid hydroxylase superfamily)
MGWTALAAFLLGHPTAVEVSLFGAILVGGWTAERICRPQPTLAKLKHTGKNAIFLTGALPVQLYMMTFCIAAANWVTTHHFGLLYLFPHPANPWLALGLMFLALDFLDYAYHFTAHRLPLLWRLHLVHHTDDAVDVSTTFREHPGETLVRVSFLILCVCACGASLKVLILRQTIQSFSNLLQHTTFHLQPRYARFLGWFLVTPNLHHTHHHYRHPGTNCNYGDVFSIWDRVLGTFIDLPHEETVFGLDTHMEGGESTRTLQLLGLGRLASLRNR